ncbi:complement resistance protein TraT [Nitrosovibrio sp. Nv17]|jgi:outer membrane lipoprotein SlyB|uniref:complement resistance protein TraT n=1 Tax=Nitrosovibrio sp. Nv17 TaxID=1855339 RepID=UPI0009086597|nr:complement resistance protein TraT [Nitrosovibrio sp. Nv17]SFW27580.1 TraT complement resistance protein [Nitrosovibrio sp. Nv17]
MIHPYSKRTLALAGAMVFAMVLSGCAAVHTSIAKKDLDVQTKMSDTIFLDPVEPSKKTIYLNIRNTSDKTNFDIAGPVARVLEGKGYKILQDPKKAHYWLQVNVLSVDKASPTAAESALRAGYGGATLAGAAVGAATGAALGGWGGAGIGGLAGAAAFGIADTIAGAAVKDVLFMAITDVEIAERAEDGVIIRQDNQQDAKQGVGGSRRQTSTKVSDMNKYRTRVVSTANKVNLQYEEAAPDLTAGLTRSISGLF